MDTNNYDVMLKITKDISGFFINPNDKGDSFIDILNKIQDNSDSQYRKIYNKILQKLALKIPLYKILFEEGYLNNGILLTLIYAAEKRDKLPDAFLILNNFFEYNGELYFNF